MIPNIKDVLNVLKDVNHVVVLLYVMNVMKGILNIIPSSVKNV